MNSEGRAPGYLPNDIPPPAALVLLGLQHVVTMFPATVLVALLCGFHVSTVLLAAGTSTLVALTLSREGIGKFIPLFYGSSFSYIAAYLGVANAMGAPIQFGVPAPDAVIRVMQAGIIATGFVNVLVGFSIKGLGKATVDRVLPPIVTGSVACVIGIGGNIGYPGGFLPIQITGVFPNGLPAIATAALMGIALNLVLGQLRPRSARSSASTAGAGMAPAPSEASLEPAKVAAARR